MTDIKDGAHSPTLLTIKEIERYIPDPYEGRQGGDCSKRWKEFAIVDVNGKEVDIIKDENMRNIIIKCVNSHADLVDALKDFHNRLYRDMQTLSISGYRDKELSKLITQAEAALVKAGVTL